jgi:hypothetical protein
MLEEHLVLPFQVQILDSEASVEAVDLTTSDQIVAVCVRGRSRQRIPILELVPPEPEPAGWEWVEAYRRWGGGQ